MDPNVEFEIDIMILDYTCCKAIHEIVTRRTAELSGGQPIEDSGILTIFDTWKTLSSTKHAGREIPRDLHAKIHLITFTTLFVYRLRNSKWSKCSLETSSNFSSYSTTNYEKMLNDLKIPEDDRIMDGQKMMQLLDILPDLLNLCTILCTPLPPKNYMNMAARFMLQCVLEQYAIFGRVSPDIIEKAFFAWEPDATLSSADINEWLNTRAEYLDLLQPDEGQSLENLLGYLTQQFPVFDFEAMVMAHIRDILGELETPTLVKLETGELGDWDPGSFNLVPGLSTQLRRHIP